MESFKVLSEIGLPTIVIVLVGLFVIIKGLESFCKWAKDKFMYFYNRKKNNDNFQETVDKHSTEITNINNKIDGLLELIVQQDEQNKKIDCAILRDRIIQSYKFHKEVGTINALDYENLKELFEQYFARGGNHLVSKIYEDFKTWNVTLDEEI
jgi:hypothetical protein